MHCLPYLIAIRKSLDTGMESYIVQLDFSAAFDRVSHSVAHCHMLPHCPSLMFRPQHTALAVCCVSDQWVSQLCALFTFPV